MRTTTTLFWLALAALPALACGDSTLIGDCGRQPDIACTDECGDPLALECNEGNWICPAVPAFACEECGPLPGGLDCIDACGDFYGPSCVGGSWICEDVAVDCPDDPELKAAEWSDSFGSHGFEEVEHVAMDDEGNVYIAVRFRESLELDPGTSVDSTGGYDALVAKYDAAGGRVWQQSFGGVDDELPHGLELNPAGELVLLLSESDVNTGNPPKAGPASLVRLGVDDGGLLGSLPLGYDLGYADVDALAIHPVDGTIVLTGEFAGDLSWNGPTLSAAGERDVYVLAIDGAGNHLWSRSLGGSGYDDVVGIDIDDQGNVLLAGAFGTPVTIDELTLEAAGYAMSLGSDGQLQWATSLAGAQTVVGDIRGYGDGGAIVSAAFDGQASLGAFDLSASSPELEGLVARLGPEGDVVFVRAQGPVRSTGSFAQTHDWFVGVDASGDVLIAGSAFSGGNDQDVLVGRLDPQTGEPRWQQAYGDDNSNFVGGAVSRDGSLVVVGSFFGSMDVGNGMLDGYIEGAGFVALFSTEAPPEAL